MRQKNFLSIISAFCLAVCNVIIFAVCVEASDSAHIIPSETQAAAFNLEELNIIPNRAILQGQTFQMQTEEIDEFVLLDFVKWTSSRPDIISCTENGVIKGLKEGSAIITVKARVGNASDSITVYCARKLNSPQSSPIVTPLAWTCSKPSLLSIQSFHWNLSWMMNSGSLEVKGVYGSYFYVEFIRNEKTVKGFILQSWMPKNLASDELFRQLSTYDLKVFVNEKDEQNKVTTNYKGTVFWNVSDKSIIKRDKDTGIVEGLKPGTATIYATAGTKTLTCTVHSIYRWPLCWTGAALKSTYVYKASGNTYQKTSTNLAVGDKFTVIGDLGEDSSWVYGTSEDGTEGYIPISHISTKGTISQYNSMNFRWPVKDVNIKKISSPFGPRSSNNGGNHKGFDIVSDVSGEVEGKSVVASYNGTIKKIYIDDNNKTSHGNAIVITTDKIDPISGKNLTVIYMHLSRWNTNSSGNIVVNGNVLKEGGSVTKEQIIGCAGNTGYNTSGAHLHYEVNNQNAAIRSGSNNPFAETINPIFFYMYMDNSITKSNICEAASNGNGFYWYSENE